MQPYNGTRAASRVSTIEDEVGRILELDVIVESACSAVFNKAESLYGQVDVLVNNARYSLLGAVEDLGDEEAVTQMEPNFFSPHRLIRSALPGFRTREIGTIVDISSVAGIDGLPSCSLYAASKSALEGLSESLARELAPFNVKVLIVEPGAFRTKFMSDIAQAKKPHTEDKPFLSKFASTSGTQSCDPSKAAARIIEAMLGTGIAGHLEGKVLRMPLGDDCVARFGDLERGREVAGSKEF